MRTIFIGDLHGCAAEFEALLTKVNFTHTDRVLLTGDAFSRGPDPQAVWDLILATGAEMVLGNHDARLLQQLEAHHRGDTPRFKRPGQRVCFEALSTDAELLLLWLQAVPLVIDEKDFLLVHAGIHPEKGLAATSRDELLTIRTWPPTGGIDGPRWHHAIKPWPQRMILFGHDAPGGLVIHRRKGKRPWAIGLDSGCIYGGQLTAYLFNADRIVQVPSQQGDGRRWY